MEEEILSTANTYIQCWCVGRLILALVYGYLYYLSHT